MPMKKRHQTVGVDVAGVRIGGDAPIVVQSMTNTDTADIDATVAQVYDLWQAGSELVRLTVNNEAAAAAVAPVRDALAARGCDVPLIGDFHFNGHKLLAKYPECAEALAKLRINPGNVGRGSKRDAQFAMMVETAVKYDKAVRIGVNGGSLDDALLTQLMDENAGAEKPLTAADIFRETMVRSALDSASVAESLGLGRDRIVLSVKMSQVQEVIAVYEALASRSDYALHVGLTEAGMGSKGIVASSAALGVLLQQGVGDTIRISLTPEPGGDRTKEVVVAQELLQTMGFRSFSPLVTACPGCGRTTSTFFQQLGQEIQSYIRAQMPDWRQNYPGVEEMTVAVMGCVVNGPGESKLANIGISLPGTGERPVAPVYIDGQKDVTLKGDSIAQEFQAIVDNYVRTRYAA